MRTCLTEAASCKPGMHVCVCDTRRLVKASRVFAWSYICTQASASSACHAHEPGSWEHGRTTTQSVEGAHVQCAPVAACMAASVPGYGASLNCTQHKPHEHMLEAGPGMAMLSFGGTHIPRRRLSFCLAGEWRMQTRHVHVRKYTQGRACWPADSPHERDFCSNALRRPLRAGARAPPTKPKPIPG